MIAIKVPPLGESTPEATVSRWMKQPGDAVAAGETVVELETDKVTVEVPAIRAGVVVSQSHKEGDTVKVDEILGQFHVVLRGFDVFERLTVGSVSLHLALMLE